MADYRLSTEMAVFIEKTQRFSSVDSSLAASRQAYNAMCHAFTPPRPPGLSVADFTMAGVPVRRYLPPVPPPAKGWPALLYMHGGGWVVGGLDSHDFICAELAMALGVLVIAIDYRLAPEHPFPAAFDDCLAVWRALWSGEGTFNLDRERLLVIGDSAGGNLAAALCLALRDAGERLPLAQVLIYPGLGGSAELSSRRQCANAPLLSSSEVDDYLGLYLSGPVGPSPYAMPLLAGDFDHLPPALIAVAEHDPLRDDGVEYARALQQAGGHAELYYGTGLVHGCLRGHGQVPEVDRLYEKLLAWLQPFLTAGR